jgi:hypothetical protein
MNYDKITSRRLIMTQRGYKMDLKKMIKEKIKGLEKLRDMSVGNDIMYKSFQFRIDNLINLLKKYEKNIDKK